MSRSRPCIIPQAQPEAGNNIIQTKKDIEDAIDVINEAFENLLDSLFQDMAWDISSDISVMKTMMAQDGLTPDSFSQMQGSQGSAVAFQAAPEFQAAQLAQTAEAVQSAQGQAQAAEDNKFQLKF